MRTRSFVLAAAFCLSGCGATLNASYESHDLLVVQHNTYNDYMLMVYRDAMGQTRHIVRRRGVCEMVLTYELDGDILLKARGEKVRSVDAFEAARLTYRINSLLKAREEGGDILTSI